MQVILTNNMSLCDSSIIVSIRDEYHQLVVRFTIAKGQWDSHVSVALRLDYLSCKDRTWRLG